MANPFNSRQIGHYEHDVAIIAGFIALDSSSNVIGLAPTTAPPGSGPYSVLKGASNSFGVALTTQPHTSTGLYTFVLDEPWMALLFWDVSFLDGGNVQQLTPTMKANVRGNTTGPRAGIDPGTDTTITAQNLQLRFRTNVAGGALADPTASTGFWMRLMLKRTAIY